MSICTLHWDFQIHSSPAKVQVIEFVTIRDMVRLAKLAGLAKGKREQHWIASFRYCHSLTDFFDVSRAFVSEDSRTDMDISSCIIAVVGSNILESNRSSYATHQSTESLVHKRDEVWYSPPAGISPINTSV